MVGNNGSRKMGKRKTTMFAMHDAAMADEAVVLKEARPALV